MALENVKSILDRREAHPSDLIEALQDIQETEGFISRQAMCLLSERLAVPLVEVVRVAHFYKAFSLTPPGLHTVTVCNGTACHVRGTPRILDEVQGQLSLVPGETTEDGLFTLHSVNCLGTCALGPVVVIDGVYHDRMTPGKLRSLIQSLRSEKQALAVNA